MDAHTDSAVAEAQNVEDSFTGVVVVVRVQLKSTIGVRTFRRRTDGRRRQ